MYKYHYMYNHHWHNSFEIIGTILSLTARRTTHRDEIGLNGGLQPSAPGSCLTKPKFCSPFLVDSEDLSELSESKAETHSENEVGRPKLFN
jgi:hypothetical protein